jgi:uroporphyrinogen-III synthase
MKILLIRPNRNEADQQALNELGIETEIDPYLQISQVANSVGASKMLNALAEPGPKWLILTSTNALTYWKNLLPVGALEKLIAGGATIKFAAIGEQTKAQLIEIGAAEVLTAEVADSFSLESVMAQLQPAVAVIPSGSIAMQNLQNGLDGRGFTIISEVVYETRPVAAEPKSVARIQSGEFDAVLLRSPSAARSFLQLNPQPKLHIICGGNSTAKAVLATGLQPDLIVADPNPSAIAAAIATKYLGAEA